MRILRNCSRSALLAFTFMAVTWSSCDVEFVVEPQTVGPSGELLVVASKNAWNSSAGDTLRYFMNQPFEVASNPEPMMDIVWVEPDQFSRYLKPHRNVLILNVESNSPKQASLEVSRNKFGSDQVFIEVEGSNPHDAASVIASRSNEIRRTLQTTESRRLASRALRSSNKGLAGKVQDHWGIQMGWPKDATPAAKSSDFWLIDRSMTRRKNGMNHDVTQFFFIHSEPLKDIDQLDPTYIVDRRDEVTQLHVHGAQDNSYMLVERRVPTSSRRLTIDGLSAREVRGWWTMENDWMGGPYYSLTFLDVKRNRVVTIEGCVYAPAFKKRPYIREAEGLLKRVKFVD